MQPGDVSNPGGVAPSPAHVGMGFREFVCLIAATMALVALAIDSMLPALPAMAHSLGVTIPNRQQFVIRHSWSVSGLRSFSSALCPIVTGGVA